MVYQCLIDKNRTLAFKKAIENSIKPGNVVVDLGSGSGILAMFSIMAGAERVYAVEADEDLVKVLEMNIERNGYQDRVIVLKGDATTISLPEKVDAVTCEMVATGLIDELQIPAMNNILSFCKDKAQIIPMIIENYLDLVNIDNNFYGQIVSVIQYEYEWDSTKRSIPMTEKALYETVDFRKKNETLVDLEICLPVKEDGIINGLRLTNRTLFPDGSSLEGTAAYCMPLIFPINNIQVSKNDVLVLKIKYNMCEGMENLSFNLEKPVKF